MAGEPRRRERKAMLLRLDPAVHDALAAWAAQDLRSVNAHVEWLLRKALTEAGRMPDAAGEIRSRGRPPRDRSPGGDD
ncbi:MAG TPA: toxin-antitoxin system HicB family antitoxin [Kineosporiaceae bacterium]|nr:toxin-antitoxin system HicB family antitoxin [Kineosporiaceae bacterium]